jgi:hypothetical protein
MEGSARHIRERAMTLLSATLERQIARSVAASRITYTHGARDRPIAILCGVAMSGNHIRREC